MPQPKTKNVYHNGAKHEFPADATDEEIRQSLDAEDTQSNQNVFAGNQQGDVYGRPPGVPQPGQPLGSQPSDVRTPIPSGMTQDPGMSGMDVIKQIISRGSSALNLGVAGAGLANLPGAIGGATLGALLPPDQTPGSSIGATAANLAFDKFFPEAGAASKGWRLMRGLLGTGATAAGAYGGAVADDQFGGIPIKTQYGKIGWLSAATGAANSLKAFTAPAIAGKGPVGVANQTLQDLTGQSIPTSVTQETGGLENLSQFVRGSKASRDLAMRQSAAAAQVIQKITKTAPDQAFDVVKGANNDVKEVSRSIWGDMLEQFRRAGETSTTVPEASNILDSSGNPFTNFVQKIKSMDDIDWQDFGSRYHLDQGDINNLRAAVKQPTAQFIDQFLTGKGALSPEAQLANTMMKVLPEEAKAQFGTALVLRTIDKSGSVIDTVNGPMLTGGSFNRAIQQAGALQQVLSKPQYDALKTLGMIMQDLNPAAASKSANFAQGAMRYLANKYTFALSGITAGALLGSHNPDIGGQVAGGIIGGAGGALVTMGLSTVLGRILTNPETVGLLQKAAKGDATAASAFLRGVIAGTGAGVEPSNSDQAQPQRKNIVPPLVPNFMKK
jgi:hypothetical protein